MRMIGHRTSITFFLTARNFSTFICFMLIKIFQEITVYSVSLQLDYYGLVTAFFSVFAELLKHKKLKKVSSVFALKNVIKNFWVQVPVR